MTPAALVALTLIAGSAAARAQSCSGSPSYSPDFSSNACLPLNGSATLQTGVLQLTQALTDQAGSAWYTTPQPVANSFSTTFTFQLTGGSADGFAFVVQNSGTKALGPDGCGMGFADDPDPGNGYFCGGETGGIPNSLAIGFKTYSGDGDEYPPGNSVFIASNGTGANCENLPGVEGPVSCVIAKNTLTSPSITLANGSAHTATITYTTQPLASQTACVISSMPTPCLDVILDGTDLFPAGVPFNMTSIGLTNNSAYVGFTGATGDAYENNDILSWTFTALNFFGDVNVCPTGQTTPAPCSSTLPVTFNFTTSMTIGSVQVVTQGATGLDFTQASGNTCTGSVISCTVNVTFTPIAPGLRLGAVQLLDSGGNVLATQFVSGVGQGPAVAFGPSTQTSIGNGLQQPQGVAVDAAGDVYISDYTLGKVFEVPYLGNGNYGAQTTLPATGLANPYGVAVDGAGDVYIADPNNSQVVKVPYLGNGTYGTQTTVGNVTIPYGVAVDGAGNVYIVDSEIDAVVKVTPSGVQTTVATLGSSSNPYNVAVDAAGNVYLSEPGNTPQIVEIAPNGTQTAIPVSGLACPYGVAVDAAGDVYVSDACSAQVVEIPPGGSQTTLPIKGLSHPITMAVDGAGDLFFGSENPVPVVEVNRSQPPSLSFATTNVGIPSSDSPQTVSVENIGNTALTFSAISFPPDFPQVGDEIDCSVETPFVPGIACPLTIDFSPTTGSPSPGTLLSETVSLTDNALNKTNATQSVSVQGTAVQPPILVPGVVGDTQAAATTAITGVGLVVTVTSQASSTLPIVPAGDVISESPVAGTPVGPGSAVNLVVSSGPEQVTVPNVVGLTQTTQMPAAATAITGVGLIVGTVTNQYSDTVPSGNVISESPGAGTMVNGGSSVNLIVSEGTPPSTDQLTLENNYFVTGDYATGGVALRGTGGIGTITIPDSTTSPGTPGVPDGADIIDGFLYWTSNREYALRLPLGQYRHFPGLFHHRAADRERRAQL